MCATVNEKTHERSRSCGNADTTFVSQHQNQDLCVDHTMQCCCRCYTCAADGCVVVAKACSTASAASSVDSNKNWNVALWSATIASMPATSRVPKEEEEQQVQQEPPPSTALTGSSVASCATHHLDVGTGRVRAPSHVWDALGVQLRDPVLVSVPGASRAFVCTAWPCTHHSIEWDGSVTTDVGALPDDDDTTRDAATSTEAKVTLMPVPVPQPVAKAALCECHLVFCDAAAAQGVSPVARRHLRRWLTGCVVGAGCTIQIPKHVLGVAAMMLISR